MGYIQSPLFSGCFLWSDGAAHGSRDALASVFAERAHPASQLSSGAHGATARHVPAEAFAAASRATPCARKRALDAASPASSKFFTHAATTLSMRRCEHAPSLIVLSDESARAPRARRPLLSHQRQNENKSKHHGEKLSHRNLPELLYVWGLPSESHTTRLFV
jgi:hypothetical protein